MPNGTYLNDVFVARVHKSNAERVKDDNQEMVSFYRHKLLVMASSCPPQGAPDYSMGERASDIVTEVRDTVDEMLECHIAAFLAGQIIEFPEDCQDELLDSDWPNRKEGPDADE
jgi:hypothetical protein